MYERGQSSVYLRFLSSPKRFQSSTWIYISLIITTTNDLTVKPKRLDA